MNAGIAKCIHEHLKEINPIGRRERNSVLQKNWLVHPTVETELPMRTSLAHANDKNEIRDKVLHVASSDGFALLDGTFFFNSNDAVKQKKTVTGLQVTVARQ
ncbi:hypothetical protein DQ04_00131260 [Trypanosoma grayi]|uniref:hypothetical protein n=1 Tax=Trypanosoma grayi TaxID=71804 RepID=UPI0004F46F0D|nr:hypothetical protein DQ04_00131260 [Trypanosoma grayi]KEG15267.1 hypothetical protein DQ04_00131260 [Trypanosoma grayi]